MTTPQQPHSEPRREKVQEYQEETPRDAEQLDTDQSLLDADSEAAAVGTGDVLLDRFAGETCKFCSDGDLVQ